jgi:hypothetical protein
MPQITTPQGMTLEHETPRLANDPPLARPRSRRDQSDDVDPDRQAVVNHRKVAAAAVRAYEEVRALARIASFCRKVDSALWRSR